MAMANKSSPSEAVPSLTPLGMLLHGSCYSLHECTVQHDPKLPGALPAHPPASSAHARAFCGCSAERTRVRAEGPRVPEAQQALLAWSPRARPRAPSS